MDLGLTHAAPVEALAKLCELDSIIVHFIASDNVEGARHGFLRKRFTSWHIQHLAVNIARQKAYQKEKEPVQMRRVEVIEVKTETTSVSPDKLEKGPEAYDRAKASALKTLSE
ncbi:MAG: hypothetical protein ABIL06_27110 [Pseudomonadota bacterium]